MTFIQTDVSDHVATVRLSHGKVNPLTDEMVRALFETFTALRNDPEVRAAILTGEGAFFSFGFDIPQFLGYSKTTFTRFLKQFTDLYTFIFGFPKPVVAALNGHATAGGCMLALACDKRLMVGGKAKISLNEIGFGSSVFAGSVEMLRFCVGSKNAQKILYSGEMYTAEDALTMGLIDKVCTSETLDEDSLDFTQRLAQKSLEAFAGIKELLRRPIMERMKAYEGESISRFVDIWYSPETWKNLEKIIIRK